MTVAAAVTRAAWEQEGAMSMRCGQVHRARHKNSPRCRGLFQVLIQAGSGPLSVEVLRVTTYYAASWVCGFWRRFCQPKPTPSASKPNPNMPNTPGSGTDTVTLA